MAADEKPTGEGSERAEQSVEAFREALEKSITISRDRLQEIVDDAVRRGRMTRSDAEEIFNRVVARGRDQAEEILAQLERLIDQIREMPDRAREEVGSRADQARKGVGSRAEQARKRAVGAVDRPLARADRVRRKARVPGFPITAYDQLSIRQIDSRLQELTRDQLRRVRDYERRNKARKGLLRALDRKINA